MPIQKYGIAIELPEPFLQKHLEQYQSEIAKLVGKGDIANSVYRGDILKAAIRCGWVKGISEVEVSDKHPGIIRWASSEIHFLVVEAQTPPPE
jgi:hypothetical protein